MKRGPVVTSETFLETSTKTALSYESADLLLPNSEAEARTIISELGITTPTHVVPNAADAELFTPPERVARSGVLYVGRIEPHKNQLGLIRALRMTGIGLTIAGPPHPHHPQYFEACIAAAGPDVVFTGALNPAELVPLYQQAQVHAMPSFFETTGLSSLEAALCECGVVTTDRGYAREYFDGHAYYCDPTSESSIRTAIATAIQRPLTGMRERALERYTWPHAAAATVAAYESVV